MPYLAVVPSNQRYNRYLLGNTNEMAEMQQLAALLAVQLVHVRGLTVRVFSPEPERSGSLAELKQALISARQWLDEACTRKSQGAMLSLHSDSGTKSHVFKIYGGKIGGPSYLLADKAGSRLEELMQTGTVGFLDYSDYLFYTLAEGYPSALIECGSHQNSHDLEFLLNRKTEMAKALAQGVCDYFGLQLEVYQPVLPEPEAIFGAHGVPYNPEAAICKHWLQCYRTGEFANLGPAMTPEAKGAPFGEEGCIVQRFESGIVVCKPHENWKCYHAQVGLKPDLWFDPERWRRALEAA